MEAKPITIHASIILILLRLMITNHCVPYSRLQVPRTYSIPIVTANHLTTHICY